MFHGFKAHCDQNVTAKGQAWRASKARVDQLLQLLTLMLQVYQKRPKGCFPPYTRVHNVLGNWSSNELTKVTA